MEIDGLQHSDKQWMIFVQVVTVVVGGVERASRRRNIDSGTAYVVKVSPDSFAQGETIPAGLTKTRKGFFDSIYYGSQPLD